MRDRDTERLMKMIFQKEQTDRDINRDIEGEKERYRETKGE